MRSTIAVLLAVTLAFGAAACGGDSADESPVGSVKLVGKPRDTSQEQTVATPPPTATAQAQARTCDPSKAKAPAEGKPAIQIPAGSPPSELKVEDVKVGTGAEVQAGARIMVHYVGVGWNSKEQFDASWDRGQPIAFSLSGVIRGWQEGIPGMKVGGRRKLTIPGDKAYGPNPPGSDIEPNETLVFVVDLLEIC